MDQQEVYQTFQRIRSDPFEFAKLIVRTKDETDRENPIKAFPADLEYLNLYCKIWQRYRLVAVPKSRRMFMSWMNIILYLWDTMFFVGRQNALVSKKEADSLELLERALFILENLDTTAFPKELIPKWEYKSGVLSFPEMQSKLLAFASGANQLRQFTLSGILADECAFWENAAETYASAVPTIEGGGRITMISSPAPGFFKSIVFDELQDGYKDVDPNWKVPRFPMEGIEVWKNPKNGFVIFQSHYSANPKKTPEFMDMIKSAMPTEQFAQEYELKWDSFIGKPVYPDWSKRVHAAKEKRSPQFGLPLIIGVDQGLYGSAVIMQLCEDQIEVYREINNINTGAERFVENVIQVLVTEFKQWGDLKKDYLVFMDPAGFSRKDTDERTYASVWAKRGFSPQPGAIFWDERRSSVEKWLIKMKKGIPSFQVHIDECPVLSQGFDGGYRYPENIQSKDKPRPVKDEFSAPHDALQYALSGIERKFSKKSIESIPGVKYNFQSGQSKEDRNKGVTQWNLKI